MPEIPLAEQIATLRDMIADFRETDLFAEYSAGLRATLATLERRQDERARIVAHLDEWIAELEKQDKGEANFLRQFRNRIERGDHEAGR